MSTQVTLEQMCRDILEVAIEERLVSQSDKWTDPHPQARSSGELCGVANLLSERLRAGQRQCWAFQEHGGAVDLESIRESPGDVRTAMLESVMGWRFAHPDRFSHDEAWSRIAYTGRVVPVTISVVAEPSQKNS